MEKANERILCAGTATIDIIAVIADDDIEKINFTNASSSYLLMEMGKKIEAQSVNWYFGGGATNAALSMKRLGLTTDCFAKIGQDNYGQAMLTYLQEHDIGVEHIIQSVEDVTAISVLTSSHDRDPAIITHRGANGRIGMAEVPWDSIKDYDAVYITNLSNQSAEIFIPLVKHAYDANVKVISNPGIRQLSNSETDFLDALAMIDMLVINKTEAQQLAGLLLEEKKISARKTSSKSIDKQPIIALGNICVLIKDFLEALQKIGVSLAVVTDGKNGAYIYYESDLHHEKITPVKALGSVGAGDAFSSTLSALWLKGMPVKDAARYASLNASHVVQSIDAHSGLQTFDHLKEISDR